jgi:ribonuclease BN (tRNA processing enzyme)
MGSHRVAWCTVRLTVIGCSGSFPGPDSPASCYLVEAEGFRLLIDLGSGGLSGVQRLIRLDQIDAICISHLHSDHCIDLCGLSVARMIHPGGPLPRLPVHGPDLTELRLKRALDARPAQDGAQPGTAGDWRFTDAFSFAAITAGTQMEIGPLRVTTALMNHPVQTFGFRLEHAGRSLAYSADTGPNEALVGLARDADVLLCEASFAEPAPGAPPLPEGLHLTARQAGQHAARAGAGQLVLTHLVPWNDADRTLEEASQEFGGPSSVAFSGLELTLE